MTPVNFYIITGLSGAGKTFANKCLEDLGFYCVDNLPPKLIANFAELCAHSTRKIEKVSLVLDIRGGVFFDDVFSALDTLDKSGYKYCILFLDASNEILIRRFKETRRLHPLSGPNGSIQDGLEEERRQLKGLCDRADFYLDTSKMTPWELKRELARIVLGDEKGERFDITIISFGYRYGIPLESDIVLDVRFLPNPYYEENLKNISGISAQVDDFVMSHEVSKEYLKRTADLLLYMLPLSKLEGKANLVISIGCTAGFHRSVVIADELYKILKEENYEVSVIHRDLKTV
ncbi:MAG: RNase adapter RapZ [bacterium]